MATSAINVGTLRAVLTADTAQWTAGFRTASAEHQKFASKFKSSSDFMIAGMSQAGKEASASGKMIAGMSLAGRQAAAAQAAAAQASIGWGARLKNLGGEALATTKATGLLNGSVGSLVLGLGSLSIIGTVAGMFTRLATNAVDTAGKLSDLSAKTGISVTGLQQMDAVAEQTGSSIEGFSKAVFQLGVRVEAGSKPVTKAVQDLGLSFKELQALKPEEQFRRVADALGAIEDPQRRNEIALRLFGKAAQEVMPAIVEGYGKMADAAQTSGADQIAALDAAGDAWTRFKKDADAAVVGFLGGLVLMAKGMGELSLAEKIGAFLRNGPAAIAVFQGIGAAAQDASKKSKEHGDISLNAAKASETYAQQLARVRQELNDLKPAERAEIAAAQALGVSTDELEAKYGLTEGALRVLTAQTTANARATKDAGKSAKNAAEEFQAWQRAVADVNHDMHKLAVTLSNEMTAKAAKQAEASADAMLGSFNRRTEAERDAASTSRDIEEQRAEFAIEQAKRNGASWQQVYAMEKALADARLQRTIDQAEEEFQIRTMFIDRTTAFGEAEYQALKKAHDVAIQGMVEEHGQAEALKRDELRKTHSVWRQTFEQIKGIGDSLVSSISDNFSAMLLGAKSFKDGFVGIWQSIKQSVIDVFSDILNSFIKGLLGGMMNALRGQQGGFAGAFGGILGGGGIPGVGGGGGLLGGLLGGASGGLFAAGGASSGLASGAAINATTAGLAGGGAGAGGAGAAITGLLTNPITIAAGAAALLGFGIIKKGLFRGGWEGIEGNRRRDQFQAQFGGPGTGPDSGFQKIAEFLTRQTGEAGGGRIFRDLQSGDRNRFESAEQTIAEMWNRQSKTKVQTFQFGGMVRGLGAVPAVLHGGEGVLSRVGVTNVGGPDALKAINAGRTPSANIVNLHFVVQAWDSIDAARWLRTQGIPEIKRAITLNTGGLGAAVAEA